MKKTVKAKAKKTVTKKKISSEKFNFSGEFTHEKAKALSDLFKAKGIQFTMFFKLGTGDEEGVSFHGQGSTKTFIKFEELLKGKTTEYMLQDLAKTFSPLSAVSAAVFNAKAKAAQEQKAN